MILRHYEALDIAPNTVKAEAYYWFQAGAKLRNLGCLYYCGISLLLSSILLSIDVPLVIIISIIAFLSVPSPFSSFSLSPFLFPLSPPQETRWLRVTG